MRGARKRLLAICAVASASIAAACGGPRMRTGELYAGRVECAPSIECLPDPDVVDEELSERMRFGMRLASEAFDLDRPAPPASRSALDLTDWANGPLREWLARKTEAVEAARHELDAAAEESQRQRIMGGAIVGMLYEDVARALRAVPAPEDLDDEPEILDMYRQVVRSQSRPFLETARRAYHACALNAVEPRSMRHWADFCRGREELLPAEGSGRRGDQGTSVEMVTD